MCIVHIVLECGNTALTAQQINKSSCRDGAKIPIVHNIIHTKALAASQR